MTSRAASRDGFEGVSGLVAGFGVEALEVGEGLGRAVLDVGGTVGGLVSELVDDGVSGEGAAVG